MLDWTSLGLFVGATVVLLVVPGPAVLYIVARSVDQGRTAGLVSVVGIHLATLVHIAAAAAGLSAVVASSAQAFAVVKYLGAAYLVYLGVRRLIERDADGRAPDPARQSLRRVLVQGALVNLLNPKTALFFLAFLPQFVDPARGAFAVQIILLGAIFVALGLVSDGAYALLAGTAARRLRSSTGVIRLQRYSSAAVYLGLGVATALARKG